MGIPLYCPLVLIRGFAGKYFLAETYCFTQKQPSSDMSYSKLARKTIHTTTQPRPPDLMLIKDEGCCSLLSPGEPSTRRKLLRRASTKYCKFLQTLSLIYCCPLATVKSNAYLHLILPFRPVHGASIRASSFSSLRSALRPAGATEGGTGSPPGQAQPSPAQLSLPLLSLSIRSKSGSAPMFSLTELPFSPRRENSPY